MPSRASNKPKSHRRSISAPFALRQMSPTRAILFAASFSSFATATSGAELQRSCIEPPATVIEITGVNTKHARATAKFTEPDIVKACHEGYVNQGGDASPEECIRQTKADHVRVRAHFRDYSQQEIRQQIQASYDRREQYWLDRILELDCWPVLFICGANHVESFGSKLRASGLSAKVLISDWSP